MHEVAKRITQSQTIRARFPRIADLLLPIFMESQYAQLASTNCHIPSLSDDSQTWTITAQSYQYELPGAGDSFGTAFAIWKIPASRLPQSCQAVSIEPMLVQGTASRGWRIFTILLLLLVVTAISAQTFHLHSSAEAASARHCTLCEVAPGILPVLSISILAATRLMQPVELDELHASLQFSEGSNLSVRPPPSTRG